MNVKNPTVIEMVAKHLIKHGYDGLYYDDCGCAVGDLAPCGHINENCQAGYDQGPHDGYDGWIGPDFTVRCPECNDQNAKQYGRKNHEKS